MKAKQRYSGQDKALVSEVTWLFLRFLKNKMCVNCCQGQTKGEKKIWTDLEFISLLKRSPANLLCVLPRRASKMGWKNSKIKLK